MAKTDEKKIHTHNVEVIDIKNTYKALRIRIVCKDPKRNFKRRKRSV